jgi:acetoin utilization deacetylase AcuC-like enzyme
MSEVENVRPPGLYFHHPACLEHDPRAAMPWAVETPPRLRAVEDRLQDLKWLGWEPHEAPAATEAEIELIHSARHVEFIRELGVAGGGAADAETWVGEGSYRAALHAAGAGCEMVRALIGGEAGRGFCAVRPPGHHAERDRATGFCLFNNVAIAAQLAITELGVERIFILDWDVHHGNGTAEAFRHRSDVLFASIHEAGSFPGTGQASDMGSGEGTGYTINLPVPPGSEGGLWLSLLEHVILPAASEFAPQLILISAGYDAHEDDPLASGRLQNETFAEMARQTRDLARELDIPVGAMLEGGYEPQVLAECVADTMSALSSEEAANSIAPDPLLTSRAAARVGHYWQL